MKQTAVEWLAEVTTIVGYVSADFLKQAKEMEKQQIIDANRAGVDMCIGTENFITGQEYYKETFNK